MVSLYPIAVQMTRFGPIDLQSDKEEENTAQWVSPRRPASHGIRRGRLHGNIDIGKVFGDEGRKLWRVQRDADWTPGFQIGTIHDRECNSCTSGCDGVTV